MKTIDINELYETAPIMSDKAYIIFHRAIGDEVRHNIYKMIVERPGITAKEIWTEFKETQPTISFHLKELKKAKLVVVVLEGRRHHFYPDYKTIASLHKTIIQHHINANDPIGQYYKAHPRKNK